MRDLAREAHYPLTVRQALETWLRAKNLRPRVWRPTRWDMVYKSIEEDLASGRETVIVSEFLDLAAKAETEAGRRRDQRRLSAARRIWDRQAAEVDVERRRHWSRLYGGKDVWLWHGTSTALLPEIRERGLLAEPPEQTHPSSTPGYVYLTTIPGGFTRTGGDAIFYARAAASRHGGDPVLLRVIVPWDELEPDMDDEDIESGNWQFRTEHDIPPDMIREIGEERVGWPGHWPKYRNGNPISDYVLGWLDLAEDGRPIELPVLHGSPDVNLPRVLAKPPARQYDNGTSQLGAFFTTRMSEALHYAGKSGRVYRTTLRLERPFELPMAVFSYLQDPTKDAERHPVDDFDSRLKELRHEGRAIRQELERRGYDGVIVRNSRGEILEVASFDDVEL